MKFNMAIARAAPSSGSVPAPSSSKRQSDSLSHLFNISTIFAICEEKVDRDCSMLCSSPMSAYISRNKPSFEPSAAGIKSPDSPIRVSSPTVLRVTVFPPVLGPVIISWSKSSPRYTFIGTAFFSSMSGCLASFRSKDRSSENVGLKAFMSSASKAQANV